VFEQTNKFFWQQSAPMTSLNKEADDFRQSTGGEVAFLENFKRLVMTWPANHSTVTFFKAII
jgi:hypothetical protein